MVITQWHVPIDDENCYWYSMFTSFKNPVDKELMRAQRLKEHRLPDYAPLRNKSNNYGYDPEEQAVKSFTGMGLDINVHDQWAVESPGPIFNRRNEHLGKTDVGIIKYRRMLRDAIENLAAGNAAALPMSSGSDVRSILGPVSIDAIGPWDAWRETLEISDTARRQACIDWDAKV